jgi:hypothetical protein
LTCPRTNWNGRPTFCHRFGQFAQYLLRALVYRAITDRLFREHEPLRPDNADPYVTAVDLACRLAGVEEPTV